jgi:hypothetical protein
MVSISLFQCRMAAADCSSAAHGKTFEPGPNGASADCEDPRWQNTTSVCARKECRRVRATNA